MLARQAKRAAQHVEETVLAELAAFLPVFFGGRKRKAYQISRRGKETATHARSEHSAFEQATRRVACGRKPAKNSIDEFRRARIGLHLGGNFSREL